ncbi:MAG: hypothetical protein SPF89_11815 [Sphaerochaetaceae bacterium]|nr:hypothetical protein [Spirochaetales bacterium]MDY5500779.1 hypothetical protein [Sphaerochaetaceae bacterium]
MNQQLLATNTELQNTKKELMKLRDDFVHMMDEQRKSSSLAQASTELIAVRQEMEKRFGNYSAVRNSMIGILQATDSALVRKTTVSTVSEELMISTPNYWLSPVLVALAAWINNDKDLADRAIREAVKRDNEHTSLVMALICRRNNRTQTSYEWLSRYFATQNSASFDEDSMVYINAYINGIFGPDEKHMCDDFISRWISEIQSSNSNFDDEQTETWQQYFDKFNVNEEAKYPALMNCVKEFGYIKDYLSRIDAVDSISEKFETIRNAQVDQDALRKAVDKKLIELVNADDKAEVELRQKEEYYEAVKACHGDEDAARRIVEKRRVESRRKTMDLVSHLVNAIKGGKDVLPSERKTAVTFLSGYINKGFGKYINEKKGSFPKQITIDIDDWTGQSSDGNDGDALKQDYKNHLDQKKGQELASLDAQYKTKGPLIMAGIVAVASIVALLLVSPIVGGLGLVAALLLALSPNKTRKARSKAEADITDRYSRLYEEGAKKIDVCTEQWRAANNAVKAFEEKKIEKIA